MAPLARSSGETHRVATSSYACDIRAVFYGLDKARFLKILAGVILFGNEGVCTAGGARNDNSISL